MRPGLLVTWVCETCGTEYPENPNGDADVIGCPECGDFPDPDDDSRPA